MKKQKIEKWQYILDNEEMKTVIDALRYVKHRIVKHNSKGAKTIPLQKIDNILKEFDYKFSYECQHGNKLGNCGNCNIISEEEWAFKLSHVWDFLI